MSAALTEPTASASAAATRKKSVCASFMKGSPGWNSVSRLCGGDRGDAMLRWADVAARRQPQAEPHGGRLAAKAGFELEGEPLLRGAAQLVAVFRRAFLAEGARAHCVGVQAEHALIVAGERVER